MIAWGTQAYNRYSYANNNPLKYTEPDGNNPLVVAVIVAAAVSAVTYTIHVAISPGGFSNWNWVDFAGSLITGAVQSMLTYGIGSAFGATGNIGHELLRVAAHGSEGYVFGLTSGNGTAGFLSSAVSSLVGSGVDMYGGNSSFLRSDALGYAAAGIMGGVSSGIAGGNFWEGAGNRLITEGLNHLAPHYITTKGKSFKDQTVAHNYMWEHSHNANGKPTIENAGYIISDNGGGVLVLPNDKNGSMESNMSRLTLKYKGSQYTAVQYDGKWYSIGGSVHIHPYGTVWGMQAPSSDDWQFASKHMTKKPNFTIENTMVFYYSSILPRGNPTYVGSTSDPLKGKIILYK